MPKVLRDSLVGIVALVVGGLIIKYADLPTRVSVLEAGQQSMDHKLDLILEKLK